MEERILRKDEVVARVGLGRSAIYRAISEGEFPKPVKLSRRSVGWLESEIQAWIREQAEKREADSNA